VDRHELIKKLAVKNESKVVLLVMDGIGDLPIDGKTPLMAAKTPNLDALAKEADLGQTIPVLQGITPGSGPGHLGLFGYDPLKYQIGRGILEAIKEIDGVKISVYPGKEHRFVVKFTAPGLDERISDADPQKEGKEIVWSEALVPEAESTAKVVNSFLKRVREVLKEEPEMNFALLRGFSKHPVLPTFDEVYKMKAAAIATYPMYRGLAKLVGMNVVETGTTLSDEIETLGNIWNEYDFFFVHVKKTDSYGEDGNFEKKVKVIEEVDTLLPEILALNPDVIVVTGDHSTPAKMKAHSWHPVPFMIRSNFSRSGLSEHFNEYECARGTLGNIMALDVVPLMMAHALRLEKYGA